MKRRSTPTQASVHIVHDPGATPAALLRLALDRSGFGEALDAALRVAAVARGAFRVVIKPDVDFFQPALPDGTTPALVEALIDELHDRGFAGVAVADGRNEFDGWLQNREGLVVPDLAGYAFRTAKGRDYRVVDVNAGEDEWGAAHFRIDFAKNRTHERYGYALCVHNLAGLAPARTPDGTAKARSTVDDCVQRLRCAPPHFNLIDAWSSCHGAAGHRAPRALQTCTFIASTDAILADWAAAAKMGLDPFVSEVNAAALNEIGLPSEYRIAGDLAPYAQWRNVHPLLAQSARLRGASDALGDLAPSWFQSVDLERFPMREFYNDRINAFVSKLIAELDGNARSFWAAVALNYVLAWVGLLIDAQQAMFAKGKVRRRVAALRTDPTAFTRADFEAIPRALEPYEGLLGSGDMGGNATRWRHVEGSVVFRGCHAYPIPFDDFVARVEVAHAIRYMNDYIGGSAHAARLDRRGRPVHQLERNLYLPQPNWMVLFGQEPIDVEKIELVRHGRDEHAIWWRTVGSPNGSAEVDDGSVSFSRRGKAETVVRIVARQKFSLPLLFRVLDVNLAPAFRDSVIENAYETFFRGTIANLQAAYEGREFRIGSAAEEGEALRASPAGTMARHIATAAAAFAQGLNGRAAGESLGQWVFRAEPPTPRASGFELDEKGFRHFAARPPPVPDDTDPERTIVQGLAAIARDAPDYAAGLAEAVRKDLDRIASGGPR